MKQTSFMKTTDRSISSTQMGLAVNFAMAAGKFTAGIFGHSYALIADGIESSTDIISSIFVLGGLKVSASPPDHDHPFGHGKAEAIAAAAVSLTLVGMAVFTAFSAIHEALIPHESPAAYTLAVLLIVILIKEFMFRRVSAVGKETGSQVVKTDAWHHRSDAISSGAAFIGISIAIIGGRGWESADDWASLIAAFVIVINAILLLLPALNELMDRMPSQDIVDTFHKAALSVKEVQTVEKLRVLRRGTQYYVDIHIQMNGNISLIEAHKISGKVKSAFRKAMPFYADGSIHMEPFDTKMEPVTK
ncbi:MAG: cation diffusion facilitator family transporter [Candidatus Peribacteria bacterium]|nr:cation diffusion facilitator family transporter [Candidatus Peribacteria bacterium]